MPVDGLPEVLAGIDRYERDVAREARRVISGTVQRIAANARRLVPVGSGAGPFPGHVRDQIRTQMHQVDPAGAVFVERRRIGGYWGTDNVAIWLEYGCAGQRIRKSGGRSGVMHARPFMRPATELERARCFAELSAVFEARKEL